MFPVHNVLDCGCVIYGDGRPRSWCPTCANGGPAPRGHYDAELHAHICGGSGKLTPEARAELQDFAKYLNAGGKRVHGSFGGFYCALHAAGAYRSTLAFECTPATTFEQLQSHIRAAVSERSEDQNDPTPPPDAPRAALPERSLDIEAIQKRYDATLSGLSSNPGVYYESSQDVPALLEALAETRAERTALLARIAELESQ